MKYILICGESYKGLNFAQREKVREKLISRLARKGIKFVEYTWIWDESDQAQLLFYECTNLKEAKYWIKFLIKHNFNIKIVENIP